MSDQVPTAALTQAAREIRRLEKALVEVQRERDQLRLVNARACSCICHEDGEALAARAVNDYIARTSAR